MLTGIRITKINFLKYIVTLFFCILFINLTLQGSVKTYIHLGISCLLIGCFYGLFRGVVNPVICCSEKYNKAYVILFALAFIVSEIFLLINVSSIYRSINFFSMISVLYGIIALEILAFGARKYCWLIITQIFMLSLFIKYSYFLNSYQFQDDPGFHLLIADMIAQQGYIPLSEIGSYYGVHPIFHIYCAVIMAIPNLNTFNLQFITSAVQTLSIIFIYLIAFKYFKNAQIALFSALIYSIFGLGILYGYLTTTEGFSSIIILVIFLSFSSIIINRGGCSSSRISLLSKEYINFYSIIVLCLVSLIMTHLLYFGFGFLWIVLLIFSLIAYNFLVNRRVNLKHIIVFILLLIGIFIYIVARMPPEMHINLFSIPLQIEEKIWVVLGSIVFKGRLIQNDETIASGYGAFLLTNFPILIFYSFITAYAFISLRPNNSCGILLGIWACLNLIFLFAGTIMGDLLGISFVIARYHYFMGMILSLMGGYVLSDFACMADNKSIMKKKNINYNMAFLIIFIIGLSLLSNLSERSNNLDPLLYEKDTPHIFFHTFAERDIMNSIFKYMPENALLVTDLRTASRNVLPFRWRNNAITFSSSSLTELSLNHAYVLLSRYSLNGGMLFLDNICQGCPYRYGDRIDKPALNTKLEKFNKIYMSNIVDVYKAKV